METAASLATQPEIKVEVSEDESLLEYFTAAFPGWWKFKDSDVLDSHWSRDERCPKALYAPSPFPSSMCVDGMAAHECDVSTQTVDADFGERYMQFTKVKTRAEKLYRQVESLSRCLLSTTEEMGLALEEARDLSVGAFSFPSQTTSADLHVDTNFAVGESVGNGNNEMAPSTILNSQSHALPSVENSPSSQSAQSPDIGVRFPSRQQINQHDVEEMHKTKTEIDQTVKYGPASPTRSVCDQDNDCCFGDIVDASPIPTPSPIENKKMTHLLKRTTSHDSVSPAKKQSSSLSPSANKRPRLSQETGLGAQSKKRLLCQFCGYSTANSCHLKRHERIHTGEKPFQCSHCDYASVQQSDLTVHIRTHTGEKPFKCPNCHFRTALNSRLTEHIRIHTGERPYKCTQCPYVAAQFSTLQHHKNRNHSV